MPYFKINEPNNALEKQMNIEFWNIYNDITNNYEPVFENDLPNEMSNGFRKYGALNQFNPNYHYFRTPLGTLQNPKNISHRYRTQIIAARLERIFDMDFEVHHYSSVKDEFKKYDDTKVFIIYGDSKEEVKNIHQTFHTFAINLSKRKRGEIR